MALQFNAGVNKNVYVHFGGFSCVKINLNTCLQSDIPKSSYSQILQEQSDVFEKFVFYNNLGIYVLYESAAST